METQFPFKLSLSAAADEIECVDKMAQQSAVNNALGTLIGYVGAEAATHDLFERILWPQRFYNGFSLRKVPKMALLLPMGGPLHKAALATLDRLRANGLFKGRNLGHMLGSPFYDDTHIKYTMHDCLNTTKPEEELVRNGLWIRAIANLPIPQAMPPKKSAVEAGLAECGKSTHQAVRSINRVSHLRLSVPDHKPLSTEIIGNETGHVTLTTYLALMVSELTGVAIAFIVIAVWRSWFALLWFAPLCFKLTSAMLAVPRGPLETPTFPPSSSRSETPTPPEDSSPMTEKPIVRPSSYKKFEIHDLRHGFLLIEGDENLILQFFRHYGHPIRVRSCEYAQFVIIIAFAILFPVGLLCSMLWMPFSLQYVWLGHQLFATLAMYAYRFADGHSLCTTEQRISERFEENATKGVKQNKVYFGGKEGVLMAELDVTYHNRVRDGKAHLQRLLFGERIGEHGQLSQASSSDSSLSTCSRDQSMSNLTPSKPGATVREQVRSRSSCRRGRE